MTIIWWIQSFFDSVDFELFVLQARGGIEQDVLEAYCWMYSTWNIPKEYKGACSGGDQVRKLFYIFLMPLFCGKAGQIGMVRKCKGN